MPQLYHRRAGTGRGHTISVERAKKKTGGFPLDPGNCRLFQLRQQRFHLRQMDSETPGCILVPTARVRSQGGVDSNSARHRARCQVPKLGAEQVAIQSAIDAARPAGLSSEIGGPDYKLIDSGVLISLAGLQVRSPQAAAPWHFLYFLPDPQGHGSFLPTFAPERTGLGGSACAGPA